MNPVVTAAAPPRHVLLRLAPFVLIIFCAYLSVGMPLAAIPLQVHDRLGFGSLTVGIAIGIQSLATLATRQFAGAFCDRSGARFGVLVGAAVQVAGGMIYLLSALPPLGAYPSLGVLLAGRVILGLGESLVMTGSLAWGIGVVGAQNTGRVMVWVGIGLYAAIAAGGPIGIHLMAWPGAAGGFAAVSIATIISSILAAAPIAFIPGVPPPGGERLSFLNVIGRVAPFGFGLALATVGFGAIAAFAALDFQDKGWGGAGFVLTGFGFAYVLTRLTFGAWPDRFGGARVAAWSLLIEGIGQATLWLAPAPAAAFAGAILTGTGYALVFPSFGIEAVKRVPPSSRGAALGAYVAFFDLGFALAGPTTGLIAGAFGYPWVFAAGASAAIAAIVAARTRSRESAPQ